MRCAPSVQNFVFPPNLENSASQSVQDYTPYGDSSAQLAALLTTCRKAMTAGDAVTMNAVSANSSLHLVGDHMYNVLSVNAAAVTARTA